MENNLNKFRKEAGLNLQALGDLCLISMSHIQRLGEGKTCPTLFAAYKIAAVLGKSVEEIWPNKIETTEETVTIRRIK